MHGRLGSSRASAARCSRSVRPCTRTRALPCEQMLDETGLRRALYAGDDSTDADGFRALDGLEVGVRVAVSSDEAPSELIRMARRRRRLSHRAAAAAPAPLTKSLQIGHEHLTACAVRFDGVRLALVMGAALLAGSVAGAQARETAAIPPIVFASGQLDRDLVVMRENGSHKRVLTPAGRDDSDPSWSPDGLRIAFSFYNGRRSRIGLLELGTGLVRDLGDGFNPDWSPDGRRLVFLDAEGFDDLLTMNANGTNRRRLGLGETRHRRRDRPGVVTGRHGDRLRRRRALGRRRPHRQGAADPGRRHAGSRNLVARRPHDRLRLRARRRFNVCLVRSDGTRFRGLSRKGSHPNWSPRGGLIATTRQDVLKPGILVFRTNGKLVRALRNGSAKPDWSPNGKRLVAERELVGGPRLYATDSSRGSMARLTQGSFRDTAASWAPNGQSIAFRRHVHGRCTITVLDTESHKARTLVRRTVDLGCMDQPTWSLDGRRVYYSSSGDLWWVPSRGGRPRRLTRSSQHERGPRVAPDGSSLGFVDGDGAWLLFGEWRAYPARAGCTGLLVVARRAIDRLPPVGRREREGRPVPPRRERRPAEGLRLGRGRAELVARRSAPRVLLHDDSTGNVRARRHRPGRQRHRPRRRRDAARLALVRPVRERR